MENQQVSPLLQNLTPIPNLTGYYASAEGELFSTKRSTTPKKLSSYTHKGNADKPYLRVKIAGKLMLVHRVICSIHLGRPLTENETVNHIDGNKLNNVLENLEVTTHSENVQHAQKAGLYLSGDDWYRARGLELPRNR